MKALVQKPLMSTSVFASLSTIFVWLKCEMSRWGRQDVLLSRGCYDEKRPLTYLNVWCHVKRLIQKPLFCFCIIKYHICLAQMQMSRVYDVWYE